MKEDTLMGIIITFFLLVGAVVGCFINYYLVRWINVDIQWISRLLNILFFLPLVSVSMITCVEIFFLLLEIEIVENFIELIFEAIVKK